MCRLLGVVSRTHRPLLEAVPDELPLFTAMSEKHKDGWGVAWYARPGDASGRGALTDENAHPASGLRVRRGIDTARASTAYGQAVADADGEVILAHLRRASVGLPLELENTHPFTEGPVAFAHNGQFDMPEGLRERVLSLGGRAAGGSTDSELFFSLITVHAREHDWPAAVQRAAADLTAWIPEMGGRYPEGLNCLLTTPDTLVAHAQSDPDQLEPTSPWDTYDLRLRVDPERVVVSSSGFELEGAVVIGQGEAVEIRRDTLAVRTHAPLDGFALAPARRDGEAAWAARRSGAPVAEVALGAI